LAALAVSGFTKEALGFQDGYFTTSDGVRLHYLIAGKGPFLLFEPGWLMPASIWKHQLTYFSNGFRVVALDPRGQGESEVPPKPFTVNRRAQDMVELTRHLRARRVVWVGWSLGASEVMALFKGAEASRTAAVVLVDGPVGMEAGQANRARRAKFLASLSQDREGVIRHFVKSMFFSSQPQEFMDGVLASALRMPLDQAQAILRDMYEPASWRPAKTALTMPILFVTTPTYLEQAKYLKARVPRTRVEVFKDLGHALFVDDVPRFNKTVGDFLLRVGYEPLRP